ncbi:hypothetical protein RUK91_003111 [Vibrio cholerae]|nr:hypothetical protein [Vibrio cholerae]
MATTAVKIVSSEYRQINVGLKGVFVNRGAGNAQMLVAETQPAVTTEGDPMLAQKRYVYELTGSELVWAKANSGETTVGVTPA